MIQIRSETRSRLKTAFRNDAGQRHREDGPAVIYYRPDGRVDWEYYYVQDQKHREDGPALTTYRPDGSVEREAYYLHGLRHRN